MPRGYASVVFGLRCFVGWGVMALVGFVEAWFVCGLVGAFSWCCWLSVRVREVIFVRFSWRGDGEVGGVRRRVLLRLGLLGA